jgi:hypothetical protein
MNGKNPCDLMKDLIEDDRRRPREAEHVARQNQQDLRDRWTKHARKLLVGRRILDAEYCVEEEWGSALVLRLSGQGVEEVGKLDVWVSSDDEGNDPGALIIWDADTGEQSILPRVR